jgi:hypothetical protein
MHGGNSVKKTIRYHQDGPKAFQSNQELRDAVRRYSEYDAAGMEEIACTYGYPIDRWNVSQVEDMSRVRK